MDAVKIAADTGRPAAGALPDYVLSALQEQDEPGEEPDDRIWRGVLDELESAETDLEAAEQTGDDFREAYSRGDLQLDKYLQRLVETHTALMPIATPDVGLVGHDRRAARMWGLAAFLASSALVAWLVWPEAAPTSAGPREADQPASTQSNGRSAAPLIPALVQRGQLATTPIAADVSSAAHRAAATGPAIVGFVAHGPIVASGSARFITIRVRSVGSLPAPVQLSVRALGGTARVNEDFVPPVAHLTLTSRRPSADVLLSILQNTRKHAEDLRIVLDIEKGRAKLGARSVVVVLPTTTG